MVEYATLKPDVLPHRSMLGPKQIRVIAATASTDTYDDLNKRYRDHRVARSGN